MPDDQAKIAQAVAAQKRILSIRARLIVLALLAIAPLMFERVQGLEGARAERTERAHAEVIDLARRGAEAQREIIYSVRALLQVVARVYARMPFDRSDCDQYLTDLTGNMPWIRGLSVAGTDGQIKCSTDAAGGRIERLRPAAFSKALHSRDFALSDYLISRIHQVPSLIAAFPVIGDDGSVTGSRSRRDQSAMDRRTRGDRHTACRSSVLLIDGSGTLVAASAERAEFVGKALCRPGPGARHARARRRHHDGRGPRRRAAHLRLYAGALDASAARRRPR